MLVPEPRKSRFVYLEPRKSNIIQLFPIWPAAALAHPSSGKCGLSVTSAGQWLIEGGRNRECVWVGASYNSFLATTVSETTHARSFRSYLCSTPLQARRACLHHRIALIVLFATIIHTSTTTRNCFRNCTQHREIFPHPLSPPLNICRNIKGGKKFLE